MPPGVKAHRGRSSGYSKIKLKERVEIHSEHHMAVATTQTVPPIEEGAPSWSVMNGPEEGHAATVEQNARKREKSREGYSENTPFFIA